MPKKEGSNKTFRISKLVYIIIFLVLLISSFLLLEQERTVKIKDTITEYFENGDILTWEVKYSPEEIYKQNYPSLYQNKETEAFKETLHESLVYYPYLLLDVKYLKNNKTYDGVMLWDMTKGEMLLNTTNWNATRGFKDCLECKADKNDFKIIQELAKNHNYMSLEELQAKMQVEKPTLDKWIDNAKKKHLIVQNGNHIQLHFESPNILVLPSTEIEQQLVFKPSKLAKKISPTYSARQIMELIESSFGDEIKIRSSKVVYLPVYNLKITNEDESSYMTDWNAVTGQRIYPYYLTLR